MSASEIMPSQGTSTLDLFALRFHCSAAEPVHFPPGETANLFRGQFGKILHRSNPAMYARFFAPVRETGVPSGLRDPPRPFVLRVRHLEGATLQHFHIGLNVFETNESDLVQLGQAIGDLTRESLRAELSAVEGQDLLRLPLAAVARAPRRAASTVVSTCRVTFLSPTELKNQESPEFAPLFKRIRDRISTLRGLYGPGPLEIDFKAMGERAAAIRMTRCKLRHIDATRGTGQRHKLGGFIGVAEYEGELTEFMPYLEIAAYTGVGRQTVWGKGEISVETF
jgi:CRISPR/Cas system endoribonuclease Cas6 (RAMP superfamily)